MITAPLTLTLGPLFFNWSADQVDAFYGRIADEAPVESPTAHREAETAKAHRG